MGGGEVQTVGGRGDRQQEGKRGIAWKEERDRESMEESERTEGKEMNRQPED